MRELVANAAIAELRSALELYNAECHGYPQTLEALTHSPAALDT